MYYNYTDGEEQAEAIGTENSQEIVPKTRRITNIPLEVSKRMAECEARGEKADRSKITSEVYAEVREWVDERQAERVRKTYLRADYISLMVSLSLVCLLIAFCGGGTPFFIMSMVFTGMAGVPHRRYSWRYYYRRRGWF